MSAGSMFDHPDGAASGCALARKCLDNVNIENPLAMADHLPDLEPGTPEPDDNVQTPRKADVRPYDQNTDSIVFEMRGLLTT